ncbi:MAG: hypothetical protein JRG96_06050 [Deltaproteobacteria bacterium]|nr:hypothetical protein [Deltaproteobacteria bacterium]
MSHPAAALLLLLFLAFALEGCGYRLARYGDAGEEAPRVSVVTLSNDSREAGVETLVSDALRREVLNRGGLRLVGDPEGADYVIRGRVRPLETRARGFSAAVLAVEYEVTMALDLVVDSGSGRAWKMDSETMRASEVYLASADVEVGRKNRDEALRRLSDMLAVRVHDRIDSELLQ